MPHPAIARQKNVLSLFSPQMHTHIVEFCKELNEREYDVYILFARKAACFISILENVQLLKLRGKVVSERVLDHDLGWLKGKSIALIDDTVISGTSLYHIIKKLESIGVKSIHVNVFCVNDFWFEQKMLENSSGASYLQKPYLTVDHATSLKFCKDIVTLFSLFPRPYSTDFPIFEKLRLIDYEFNDLQNFQDWSVVDTTSKIQLAREIRCFSMSPKDSVIEGFFESIGVSLTSRPYLKLRFYTEKFNSNRTYFLCRVLPLVIFDPIPSDTLKIFIKAICLAEQTDYSILKEYLNDNKGALRFVQYYFARRFFLYALESFKIHFKSKDFKYAENIREIELLFPPHLVDIIRQFRCTEKLQIDISIENVHGTVDMSTNEQNKSFNPLLVKDVLYKKFLGLYYDKELEARRLVKLKKSDCVSEPTEQKILNRLNDGFSFEELSAFITPSIGNSKERKLLLSNFLDNSIDSGIVVPVTLERDGFTSRGYRHGEEIVWGENNDKLLGIFYERFLEVTQSAYLGRFWFEKLLVLFLRMGLKERILEEYNYSVPPPQAVSIMAARTYLYGFVTASYELAPNQETKFNPVLDLETKGYWTSERLRDIGAILSQENDENYYLKTEVLKNPVGKRDSSEPEDLDSSFSDVAEEIGELLAIAKNEKVLTSEGLVLLTSCLTVHDCIASIAAEIYIYTRHIPNIVNWVKSAVSRKTLNIGFLENLRKRHKNYVWPAINSGTDKYISFLQKDGEKLINSISNHFRKDSFKKRSWDKYWKKEIEVDSAEAPDIFALNTQIGLLLLEINIITIYLHTLIFELVVRNGEIDALKETNLTQLSEISEKINICSEKLKALLTKEDSNGQTELVFEKQVQVEKLENERERLKKEHRRISDQLTYWDEYAKANQERTKKYLREYREISQVECPVNNEAMNTFMDSAASYSEEKLFTEILRINELSLQYKKTAERLLTDFSALIPQWGKINPTVRYQGLIHIDTPNTLQSHRNQLKAVINSVMSDFEKEELLKNAEGARSIVQLIPVRAPQNIGYFIGGSGRLKIDKMSELVARIRKGCSFLKFPCSIVFYPNLNDDIVPRAFYNPSTTYFDLVHENFYEQFIDLERGLTKKSNTITIYDPSSSYLPQHYLKNFTQVTGDDYVVNRDIVPAQPNPVEVLTFHTSAKTMKKSKMIGIVTALSVEWEAMKHMLDTIEPMRSEFTPSEHDPNDYAFGTITSKNGEEIKVILALMKKMGNNDASAAVTHLLRSYPLINDVIMCGIAGGVPNPEIAEKHVRLGDIVVSDKAGVLQYDNIKEEDDKVTIRANGSLPSAKLIGICNTLEAGTYSFQTPWNTFIEQKVGSFKNGSRPIGKDILRINGIEVNHPIDANRDDKSPKVHFGAIGSSNTLLKSENKRDFLRDNHNVRAIEMEGSGIADGTWQVSKGYLVVRGIVDYCNSDKSDDWRSYSAICAAAYTKAIVQGL